MLRDLLHRRDRMRLSIFARLKDEHALIDQCVTAHDGPRVQIEERWYTSFTSADYLGLQRAPEVAAAVQTATLESGVSSVVPRTVFCDPLTRSLERKLADLVGEDAAMVFSSAGHVMGDLLVLLAGDAGVIFVDARAYTTNASAAARVPGAKIVAFRHNDARDLHRKLVEHEGVADRVVLGDGVYTAGGQIASLRRFAELCEACSGVLCVDDAHGLGILGGRPTEDMPWGLGGGGALRHHDIAAGKTAYVGSLSKAFGVPLAFVAGPQELMEHLRVHAHALSHRSPPASPLIAAALVVLELHAARGDMLRQKLFRTVSRFRGCMEQAGVPLAGSSMMPVQTLRYDDPFEALCAAAELKKRGLWVSFQAATPDQPVGGVLRFFFTARHEPKDVDALADGVAAVFSG